MVHRHDDENQHGLHWIETAVRCVSGGRPVRRAAIRDKGRTLEVRELRTWKNARLYDWPRGSRATRKTTVPFPLMDDMTEVSPKGPTSSGKQRRSVLLRRRRGAPG